MTPQEFFQSEKDRVKAENKANDIRARDGILTALKSAKSERGVVVLTIKPHIVDFYGGQQSIERAIPYLEELGWSVSIKSRLYFDGCPFPEGRKLIITLTPKEPEPQYSLQPKSKWPYLFSGALGGMTGNWLALHFQQQILHFLHLTK